MAALSISAVAQHDGTTTDTGISTIPSDIIQTHILTRLDGPSLASAASTSSQLHALSTEENLWREICISTWPSINEPRVLRLISSTLPSGHRSFYSDSFPLLDHRNLLQCSGNNCSCQSSQTSDHLISAVDIHYENKLVFSKLQYTETKTAWFLRSPFRVDLVGPKETVWTSIKCCWPHSQYEEAWLKHLEKNLAVSWIVIDHEGKWAGNISSRRAVKVERHWLSGDVELKYSTIMAGRSPRERVECGVVIMCEVREKGRGGGVGELDVREVSMHVEDMEGKLLEGKQGLEILKRAIESGERRRRRSGGEDGRERFEEYLEMKRERKERKERIERDLDRLCVVFGGVAIFVAIFFLCFV